MSIEFSITLKKSAKYLSLPDHQLSEILIHVFGFYKGKKLDKSKLVTKFVGITVAIIFI